MRVSAHGLRQAFEFFTQATGLLKISYRHRQVEMMRLRRKLEVTNQELFRSLEGKARIRDCGAAVWIGKVMQGWNS